MKPQGILFRFFTALITSFGTEIATFGDDKEIENGFCFVMACFTANKWHFLTASLGLGLQGFSQLFSRLNSPAPLPKRRGKSPGWVKGKRRGKRPKRKPAKRGSKGHQTA